MAEGWKYFLRYGDEKLEMTEGKMTVGRSRHCDLSIQEPSISRKHVFLTVGDGKIQLQDLGSSNGTFINEKQIAGESSLVNGDVLRLGNALLTVEIGPTDTTGPAERALAVSEEAVSEDAVSEEAVSEEALSQHTTSPNSGSETKETAKIMPSGRPNPAQGLTVQGFSTPTRVGSRSALEALSGIDDPDSEPTKRLDSAIDWSVLQGERAGFWPRLGATLVDTAWTLALAVIGHQMAGWLGSLAAPMALVVVTWIGWGYWGTTPGKRLFGLYIYSVDAEVAGRPGTGLVVAAIRLASCFLSFLLFGLGFVAIGFSPARLALHDRLAGTFVLRKKTQPP